VFALEPVYQEAREKLTADGLDYLMYNVEMPLIEVLAAFEYDGFRVDGEELKRQGVNIDDTIATCEKEIYRLAGHEFNINSPKQLSVVLFDEMGIKPKKKTKSGFSTGMEAIEDLADMHEIIPLIIEYRQNTKLKSTYITGLQSQINRETGRVHSSFNQTVTATGRISSTEPNLQNIPVRSPLGRLIRKAFLPADDNHILLDADYSQIELRVLAHMSGDLAMIDAFTSGKDIHAATAAKVNGVDISEVTSEMRSRAKAVNFGIVYGMSDFGLAKDLGISVAEAKRYIEAYFREYSSAKEFIDNLITVAHECGYASTLMGRRRYIPEFTSAKYQIRSFGDRVARNMPIQGTAADIIKIAMVRVYNALKQGGFKSRLILQVHDSLLIDTAIEEKEAVMKILRENMENAYSMSVPLKVNICEGANWYDCK
jgi:DNA polymerase-1